MKEVNTGGFTLIELLVVIATVGVLVTVVINNTSQARVLAEDAVRRAEVSSVAKALFVHNLKFGNWVETGSGCGNGGNGNGWFNYTGVNYPNSISACLLAQSLIPTEIIDPSKGTVSTPIAGNAYMKYTCSENGRQTSYVYAKLSMTPQSTTATDNTCCPTCDSTYGMNYFINVD